MADLMDIWSPMDDEFRRMRRMMNRMMRWDPMREMGSTMAEIPTTFMPPVEIEDTGREFIVRAELPGMSEKDVQITLSGNVLNIRGEKRYRRGGALEGRVEEQRTEGQGGAQAGKKGAAQGQQAEHAQQAQGQGAQGQGAQGQGAGERGQAMTMREERGGALSKERPMFSERYYGTFERVISLPEEVDADKVEAEFNHGILEVCIPRREERRPRQIPVKIH